jgi:hypothetical protein
MGQTVDARLRSARVPTEFTLTLAALATGLMSGLTGIGGALVLIPLLLTAPQLLGGEALEIGQVAGLSVVQVATSGLIGAVQNRRRGAGDPRLIARIGGPMLPASLLAGLVSGRLPAVLLLVIYATMATAAMVLLVAPVDTGALTSRDASPPLPFRLTATIGAGVGALSGAIGAGGAFLLIPLMNRALRVPLRTAVGSSLAITLIGTAGTLFGKLMGGQVPLGLAPWIICGAVPGVLGGVALGQRTSTNRLRVVLLCISSGVALQAWFKVAVSLAGA